MRVTGSYSFIGDDDIRYVVNYIADENGYQPTIEKIADTKFLKRAETGSLVIPNLANKLAWIEA